MSTRHDAPWFLPVVSFHPFRSRVFTGARLLLGPLCALSTPRGETSCSFSLRIFRLQLTWSFIFIFLVVVTPSFYVSPMLIAFVQSFAKTGSRLLRSLCPP